MREVAIIGVGMVTGGGVDCSSPCDPEAHPSGLVELTCDMLKMLEFLAGTQIVG